MWSVNNSVLQRNCWLHDGGGVLYNIIEYTIIHAHAYNMYNNIAVGYSDRSRSRWVSGRGILRQAVIIIIIIILWCDDYDDEPVDENPETTWRDVCVGRASGGRKCSYINNIILYLSHIIDTHSKPSSDSRARTCQNNRRSLFRIIIICAAGPRRRYFNISVRLVSAIARG